MDKPPDDQATSALRTRVYSDISEVSRDWWDSLAHPSVYLWYEWLRARSRTIQGPPRFFGVSDASGKAVMAAPSYLTDGSSHPGYDPARVLAMADLDGPDVEAEPGAAHALSRLRAQLVSEAHLLRPAVVVSSPGRMGGVSYGPQLPPAAKRDAVAAAADAIERQAAADSAPTICWLYFIEGEDEVLDAVLRERQYARVVMAADCYLPIPWTSFDEYVASLPFSRHRTIRNEMAALTKAKVRVDLHGPEALGQELAELELQWRRKYGRRAVLDETLADYESLREHVGNTMRVLVAKRAGRPVGFTTFLEDGNVWWARFGGFDYSAGRLFLYFNLAFYHPIQAAMARGIKSIAYSITSYETKRSRGCLLRNLVAYVRLPPDSELLPHLAVIDRAQRRRFTRIGHLHTRKERE